MTKSQIIDYTIHSKCPKNGVIYLRHQSKIKKIVIHHSGSPRLNPKDLITLHTVSLHKWPTVGYHFYVTKDNLIYQMNRLDEIVNGVSNHNENSLHICFEGDYRYIPSPEKFASIMKDIFEFLPSMLRSLPLKKHNDFAKTICPGPTLCYAIDVYEKNRYNSVGLIWPEIEQ